MLAELCIASNLNVANRKCVKLLADSDWFSYLTASQLGWEGLQLYSIVSFCRKKEIQLGIRLEVEPRPFCILLRLSCH